MGVLGLSRFFGDLRYCEETMGSSGQKGKLTETRTHMLIFAETQTEVAAAFNLQKQLLSDSKRE